MMIDLIIEKISSKEICILGFGREGKSTYNYIRKHFPDLQLTVADIDRQLKDTLPPDILDDPNLNFITGGNYLQQIKSFDVIIKTPGITLHTLNGLIPAEKITSQTDLFLSAYHDQVIGVTGTKGKSTTVSLIHHLVRQETDNVLLVGNIGTPPFDFAEKIGKDTVILYELSSHQLELISKAPGIAVLLNLLSEHLDHFQDVKAYHASKLNIIRLQGARDHVVYNGDDPYLAGAIETSIRHSNKLPYSLLNELEQGCYLLGREIIYKIGHQEGSFSVSDFALKGKHNLLNLMAAVLSCKLKGIADDNIRNGIPGFRGLRHRLEYIGKYRDIHFYNDSIATIPEATIAAVKALKDVDTLILGGYDRMIDYQELISFLALSGVRNIICIGGAGKRFYDEASQLGAPQELFLAGDYEEIFRIIPAVCRRDRICLLSPAAASYDMFKNFEERGDYFTRLAKSI